MLDRAAEPPRGGEELIAELEGILAYYESPLFPEAARQTAVVRGPADALPDETVRPLDERFAEMVAILRRGPSTRPSRQGTR